MRLPCSSGQHVRASVPQIKHGRLRIARDIRCARPSKSAFSFDQLARTLSYCASNFGRSQRFRPKEAWMEGQHHLGGTTSRPGSRRVFGDGHRQVGLTGSLDL